MTNPRPQWPRAADYLAQGMPKSKVARKVGVVRQTINNWSKKEDFSTLVRNARRDILGEAYDQTISGIKPAVKLLLDVLNNEEASIPDGIRAANILLNQGTKFAELRDISERIEHIEIQHEEMNDALHEFKKKEI